MSAIMPKRRPTLITLLVLVAMIVLAQGVVIFRYARGLGASTALSDGRGWGVWISFDLLCGIALAAGAFTIAATVHIFHLEKYRPILRSSILAGLLGYMLFIPSLLVDLGYPLRIWHLIIYWNIHSPLFEVGWCVMTYSTVLALEASPMVFERLKWGRLLRLVRALTIPLVIIGVVLSTMHQSSLGSLFLISPVRLHALWYSSLLPVYFFISAIAVGLAMVIFESTISAYVFQRKLEFDLLADLSRAIPYVLGLYLALKVLDLIVAGELGDAFALDTASLLFLAELGIGVIAPMILYALPASRKNRYRLFWPAVLIIVGLVFNRLNVSLIALDGATYLPQWTELAISAGIVSIGLILYSLAMRFLPVFPEQAEAH